MSGTGLKYVDKTHRYFLDGRPVPGVTTVLGVLDKPALVPWAAGLVAEFVADAPDLVDLMKELGGREPTVQFLKALPRAKRDTAAERGTTFHDFAEQIANGEEVEVPAEQVGMVEAALTFMEDYDIKPVLVEACVGSRQHHYAGKLDLVADHSQGERAIWDWKSAKRVYASTSFQCAAYAFADFHGQAGDERPMADLGIREAYGVHIRNDGYTVHPLEFGSHVFDEFLCIRRAFDIHKRAEGDWKTPGSGYVGLPTVKEVAA